MKDTEFTSQFGEDKWCFDNLKMPDNGVYVDIGCADASVGSNTHWLRRIGWTGVAIDGDAYWEQFWKGGEFVKAVLSSLSRAQFEANQEEHWVSRVVEGAPSVPATPLESILFSRRIGKIDFLSIDIEGMEFDVMGTMDFNHHKPSVIVAEYSTRGLGEDFRLRDWLVGEMGYEVRHQTEANLIYTRRARH